MPRIITYTIPENYDHYKIITFLRQQGYTARSLKLIKEDWGNVRRNGEPTWLTMRVAAGDTVTITIDERGGSEDILPVDLPFPVVYEDEDLIVVNKPPFMSIEPSVEHFEDSLGNAAAFYFRQHGLPFVYRCVNRLDRDTSGLTVIAKHFVSSGILGDMVRDRRVQRTYTAICAGEDLPDSGTVDLPISRKPDSVLERWTEDPDGDRAVSRYTVLERRGGLCLVRLRLETGRTHQIRVHMKAIGHPIIGDFLYNPDYSRIARQALHAGSLSFEQPLTKEPLSFEAELPEDMVRAFWG